MFIGRIGEYCINYLNSQSDQNWLSALPQHNWLLFVVVGEVDKPLFEQVAAGCMKHQPLGVCCAGPGAYLLEDWFDDVIVMNAVGWEEEYGMPYDRELPVTVANVDIDEGFWFTTTLAPNMANQPVEIILCLDLEGVHRARLVELIQLINSGWLPPDTDND